MGWVEFIYIEIEMVMRALLEKESVSCISLDGVIFPFT